MTTLDASERGLLDTAVLLSTLALAETIPDGVTRRDQFIIARQGATIHVLFEAPRWVDQLAATIGTKAFNVALDEAEAPQMFGRAYVRLHVGPKGAVKLVSYSIPSRVASAFRRNRTARARIDVSAAVRLRDAHGLALNQLGRTEYEPALA